MIEYTLFLEVMINDQRVKALETELQQMNENFSQQNEAKDDMIRSLQGQTSSFPRLMGRSSFDVEE
jgi:hypothetical protein